MKTVCLGLLVFFVCEEPKPAAVSDFCGVAGPQIQRLYKLSDAELAAMLPERKRAIAKLRRSYERLCK